MTIEEVSNCLEQIKNIILNSNSWTGEAKTIVEKCFNTAIKSLEAWDTIRKIFKAKSTSEDWEYIHDLQIWEDALEIIEKHLAEVSE